MNKKLFNLILDNSIAFIKKNNAEDIYYIWNSDIERLIKYSHVLKEDFSAKNIKFNDDDIVFTINHLDKKIYISYILWGRIIKIYKYTTVTALKNKIKTWLKPDFIYEIHFRNNEYHKNLDKNNFILM